MRPRRVVHHGPFEPFRDDETRLTGCYGAAMDSNQSNDKQVAGQPKQKLTLFEQIIKKTAKILRQSR